MYGEVFEELVRIECEKLAQDRFAVPYVDLSPEQQTRLRILAIHLICTDGAEKAHRL